MTNTENPVRRRRRRRPLLVVALAVMCALLVGPGYAAAAPGGSCPTAGGFSEVLAADHGEVGTLTDLNRDGIVCQRTHPNRGFIVIDNRVQA